MRWAVLNVLLLAVACSSLPIVRGSDVVTPSGESERIALLHLKGKKAELSEHHVNLRLDVSQAEFPEITDDRYPLEDRSLERDFRVDQLAFYDAFNRKYPQPDGVRIKLLKVECRYGHEIQFGQITPVFNMQWTIKGASENRIVVKGVGFGKRFNELGVSQERKRELTIESAAIAYQEAMLRCVLGALKK